MRDASPPSLESFPRVITTGICSKHTWYKRQRPSNCPFPNGTVPATIPARVMLPYFTGHQTM